MNTAFGEIITVSASKEAKSIMKQLETKELVKEQRDAWRMGAALGIAMGKEIKGERRETIQNINSLDPDDVFAAVMMGLYPELSQKERFDKLINHAEWGLREIQRKFELSTLDWTKLGLADEAIKQTSKKIESLSPEDEILAQIKQRESAGLELKSSFRWDYVLQKLNEELSLVVLKNIAGFFNSNKGGRLLIGVDDDGNILGLNADYQRCNPPNRDGFEQLLLRKVRDNIGPSFAAELDVNFFVLFDKEICVIDIPPASEPAYVPDKNKESIFYLRIGNSTNQLNVEEAMKHSIKRFYKSSG